MEEIDELTYREIPYPGYEGLYLMNGFGVKSLARWIEYETGGKIHRYFRKEMILKMSPNYYGYPVIELWKNRERKVCLFHRLKGELYIEKVEGKPFINHKNGIKTDFSLSNLEWSTTQENVQHAFDTGLRSIPSGAGNYFSKSVSQYTKEDVFISSFGSGREAMRITGINSSHISANILGKLKSAGGFIWKRS